MKKNFYKDHDDQAVIKDWDTNFTERILSTWNEEVPEHVQNFNNLHEDRSAVIYFALFVEYHVNKTINILFPDFNLYLDFSKTAISTKINILASFKLFPKQVFESCRCINNIRNEFAHEFSIIEIKQLEELPKQKRKNTIDRLISLTDEYSGDYDYHIISDTLRDRYKSLVMNTITAFRLYEPLTQRLREGIDG